MKNSFKRLVLVTNKKNCSIPIYLSFVLVCVKAGVTSVQLREKELSYDELFQFGHSLKKILDPLGVPLIINDHVDLCVQLDAAGVHLGQSDADPILSRSRLGPDKIIGLSVNTFKQIQQANSLPLDYIGLGSLFPTTSKSNIETIWGCSNLQKAVDISHHPIMAIGGIYEGNARDVMQSGADGIAAIGAFHNSKNPFQTTKNLMKIINEELLQRKEGF